VRRTANPPYDDLRGHDVVVYSGPQAKSPEGEWMRAAGSGARVAVATSSLEASGVASCAIAFLPVAGERNLRRDDAFVIVVVVALLGAADSIDRHAAPSAVTGGGCLETQAPMSPRSKAGNRSAERPTERPCLATVAWLPACFGSSTPRRSRTHERLDLEAELIELLKPSSTMSPRPFVVVVHDDACGEHDTSIPN